MLFNLRPAHRLCNSIKNSNIDPSSSVYLKALDAHYIYWMKLPPNVRNSWMRLKDQRQMDPEIAALMRLDVREDAVCESEESEWE